MGPTLEVILVWGPNSQGEDKACAPVRAGALEVPGLVGFPCGT